MAGEEQFEWLLNIVPSLDLSKFTSELDTLDKAINRLNRPGGSPEAGTQTDVTDASDQVAAKAVANQQSALANVMSATSQAYRTNLTELLKSQTVVTELNAADSKFIEAKVGSTTAALREQAAISASAASNESYLAAKAAATTASLQEATAVTRVLAGSQSYLTAKAASTTASLEESAAVSRTLAGSEAYLSAKGAAAVASLGEAAAVSRSLVGNDAYIAAKVEATTASVQESSAIARALAADNEYVTATAAAANERRAAAANARAVQLTGVGLGGEAEQYANSLSVVGTQYRNPQGQFVSNAQGQAADELAAQARAAGLREVQTLEAINNVNSRYQAASEALTEARIRQQTIQAQTNAGQESELTLTAERQSIENQLNRALRQQTAIADRAAFEADVANGGSSGSIFQQLQAALKTRSTGSFVNPNDESTFAQFLGNKALTTATFAVSGLALYGGLSQLKTGLQDAQAFEGALVPLQAQLQSIGKGDQFSGLKSGLQDIATETGVKADQLAVISQRFVGTFQDAKLAADEVRAIAQLSVVSGADLTTVAQAAQSAANNFGISARQLGDIAAVQRNAFGTPESETLQFFGSVSPVASNFGLSAREAATIAGGLTSQAPSRSGAAEAESLNRILPDLYKNAQKLVDFQSGLGGKKLFDTDALVSGDLGTALQQILENFDKLTPAQQRQFEADATSSRNQKDLIALLDARHRITDILNNSVSTQGTLEGEFAQRQETLKQKIAELGTTFRKFVQDLYDSGLDSILKAFVEGFTGIIGLGAGIVSFFASITNFLGPLKDLALLIPAFLALRALSSFSGTLITNLPGQVAGTAGIGGAIARSAGIEPVAGPASTAANTSAITEAGAAFATDVGAAGETFATTVTGAGETFSGSIATAGVPLSDAVAALAADLAAATQTAATEFTTAVTSGAAELTAALTGGAQAFLTAVTEAATVIVAERPVTVPSPAGPVTDVGAEEAFAAGTVTAGEAFATSVAESATELSTAGTELASAVQSATADFTASVSASATELTAALTGGAETFLAAVAELRAVPPVPPVAPVEPAVAPNVDAAGTGFVSDVNAAGESFIADTATAGEGFLGSVTTGGTEITAALAAFGPTLSQAAALAAAEVGKTLALGAEQLGIAIRTSAEEFSVAASEAGTSIISAAEAISLSFAEGSGANIIAIAEGLDAAQGAVEAIEKLTKSQAEKLAQIENAGAQTAGAEAETGAAGAQTEGAAATTEAGAAIAKELAAAAEAIQGAASAVGAAGETLATAVNTAAAEFSQIIIAAGEGFAAQAAIAGQAIAAGGAAAATEQAGGAAIVGAANIAGDSGGIAGGLGGAVAAARAKAAQAAAEKAALGGADAFATEGALADTGFLAGGLSILPELPSLGGLASGALAVAPQVIIGALAAKLVTDYANKRFEFLGGNKINTGEVDSEAAGQTSEDLQKLIDSQASELGVKNPLDTVNKGFGDEYSGFGKPGGLFSVDLQTSHASTGQKILYENVKIQRKNIQEANDAVIQDLVQSGLITQKMVDDAKEGGPKDPYQLSQFELANIRKDVPKGETQKQFNDAIDAYLKAKGEGKNPQSILQADDQLAQDSASTAQQGIQDTINDYQSGDASYAQAAAAIQSRIADLKAEATHNPSDVLSKAIASAQKDARNFLFTDVETEMTTIANELATGNISESDYATQIVAQIGRLQKAGGAAGAKKAATAIKDLQAQESTTLLNYINDHAKLIGELSADPTGDQLNFYLTELKNPKLNAKDRGTVVDDIIAAEKQKYQDEITAATDPVQKIALIKNGFQLPDAVKSALLSNQLTEVGGPFRDSLDAISKALGQNFQQVADAVSQVAVAENKSAGQVIADMLRSKLIMDQAEATAQAAMAKVLQQAAVLYAEANGGPGGGSGEQISGRGNFAPSPDLYTGNRAIGGLPDDPAVIAAIQRQQADEAAAKAANQAAAASPQGKAAEAARKAADAANARVLADQQALNAALALNTAAPAGNLQDPNSAADLKSAQEQLRTQQKAVVAAMFAYKKALDALKPIALAQDDIDIADAAIAAAQAEAPGLQQQADLLNAEAQKIQAQNGLKDAMLNAFQAQIAVAEAVANVTGDTVAAAKAGLESVQAKLFSDASRGAEKGVLDQDRAAVITAAGNVAEASIKAPEALIDFNLSIKKISDSQAIAQLQALEQTAEVLYAQKKISLSTVQDLEKKIFDLKQQLEGNLQFNLPTDLKLPTLYEARRVDQSGGLGNYNDNRQITITLNANNKVDTNQAVNTIVQAINAPPRVGVRPHTY